MPDNKILKNIWNHLSSKELTSSDFNTWKNNIENSDEIKNNVWNYLSDNELTTSGFDDWSKNVFSIPGNQQDPAKETANVGSENQAVDTDSSLASGSSGSQEQKVKDLINPLVGYTYSEKKNKYVKGNLRTDIFNTDEEVGVETLRKMFEGSGLQFEESNFAPQAIITPGLTPNLMNVFDAVKVTIPGVEDSIKLQFDTNNLYEQLNNINKLNQYIESHSDKLKKPKVNDWTLSKYNTVVKNNPELKTVEAEANEKYLAKSEGGIYLNDPFEQKEVTKRTGYSSQYGLTSASQEYTVIEQPYQKELAEAYASIKKNNPEISNSDAELKAKDVVRNYLYNKEINDKEYAIKEKAISDGLIDQSEVYAAAAFIKDNQAKQYNDSVKKTQTVQQNMQELDVVAGLINKPSLTEEESDIIGAWATKNDIFLDPNAGDVELTDGRVINENLFKVSNKVYENSQAYKLLYNDAIKKQQEAADNIKELDISMEASAKNYDLAEKYMTNTAAGFSDIFAGTVFLVGAGVTELMDEDAQKAWAKTGAEYSMLSQETRNRYVRDVEFKEAFSSAGNFGKFAAQEVSNQLPILVTMAASGGTVAPWVIGASSAGGKMMDMQAEIAMLSEENPDAESPYSKSEIWLKSIGYGAAEGIIEGLTTVRILKSAKAKWLNVGKDQFFAGQLGEFAKSYSKRGIIADALLESGGETLTTGVQNLIDGNSFTENMDHAAFSGFGFGLLFSAAPFLKGAYNNQFAGSSKLKKAQDLKYEINQLSKELKNVPEGDSARVQELTKLIEDKSLELADEITAHEKLINNNLTERGAKYIIGLNEQMFDLQSQAKEISNSDKSEKRKKQEILVLKRKFDKLAAVKEYAVSTDAFAKNEVEFRAFKGQDETAYNDYIDQANRQLLDERDGKEASDSDIERRAYNLYFADQIRVENKKAKGKNGIFKGREFQSFETVEQAEAYIDGRTSLTEDQKNTLKEGLRRGNDGAAIKGGRFTIAVVENQVKNQRKYTRTHEVGHQALWNILSDKKNNKAAYGIADQILTTMRKLDKSLYNKFIKDGITDANGNIDPDEVFARFLEYVSDEKIGTAQRAKGLSGLFGVLVQKEFSDQYSFNFNGEHDIYNFAVTLGRKIKDGTLTTAELKEVKSKGELKRAISEVEQNISDKAARARKKIVGSGVSDIQAELMDLEDQLMDNSIDYDTYERKVEELENKLDKAEKQEAVEKKKPKKKEAKKEDTLKQATAKSKKILDDIGNDPKGFNKNNPKIYEVLEGIIRSKSKAFKTAKGNVVNLTNLPGFEMENMVQETITGLVPLINKFNPKKNDSLFGYLNAQLANKMRGALKSGKVTDQKFTEDVTELKGVAAEETTTKQPEKPKYVKIMDADVFDTKVINAISDKMVSTVRVLKNKLIAALGKNQNTSPLIAEILSDISTQADIDIKKAMGGKKDGALRKFLLKNKQAIIENSTTTFLMGKDQGDKVLGGLPIAIQKQVDGKFLSYPEWIGKKIDRETTEKRGATAGNQIVRRVPANKISDTDYLSFFLQSTGNPIRGRKEALAKELSGELGLELFVEAIESGGGPIFDAFEGNRERMGEVLGDYYAGEVIKQVERGTIKFSLAPDVIFETFEALTNRTKIGEDGRNQAIKDLYAKYPKNAAEIKRVIVDPYEAAWQNIARLVERGKAKDKGIAYEIQFKKQFEEVAKKLRKDGLKIGSIKIGVDGIDIRYKFQGKTFGLELKYMSNARFSEFKVNEINRLTEDKKPIPSKGGTLKDLYISELIKQKSPIVNYINKVKELGGIIDKGDIYVTPEILQLMKTDFKSLFDAAQPTIMMPWNFVAEIYNNKLTPVTNIQLLDIGAFWMGNNALNTKNLPEFATFDKDGNYEKGIMTKGRFISSPAKKRTDGRTVKLTYKVTNTIPIEFRNKLANKSKYQLSAGKGIETFFENSNIAFSKVIDEQAINTNFLGSVLNPVVNMKKFDPYEMADIIASELFRDSKKYRNRQKFEYLYKNLTKEEQYKVQKEMRKKNLTPFGRGISVWDFDDTLATTKSNVLYTLPGGITGKLNAEEFAKRGDELLEQGAEFDFSEFEKVMKGAKGPMFEKAMERNKRFGNESVFILTARPANSATAIHEFLKGIGLNIKLENIVGLGNSTAQAKADWVKGMIAEGYNDFYFADDAYKNVKAVQEVLKVADVKSKVQQAVIKFSQTADPKILDKEFNLMLERTKGVKAGAIISPSRAEQLGKGKGRLDLFLPPNAEDFQGLLYKFLGKGKQGDADMKFFKENLFDPFNRAENAMSTFRQQLADNLRILKQELGNIDEDIDAETIKKIEAIGFTPDQAVRVFVWNRLGEDIPDLTKQEKAKILSVVRRDASLMRYARELMKITEQFGGYPPPSKTWFAGNSTSDLYQYANENVRTKYLEQWQANADAIFSPKNMTKIQALYGKDFAKNLKEVLRRMKSGSNRPLNLNDTGSRMLDYINGSVGTIMFLNMRSAVLQTISAVNFINWHDNNIFKAGATLANPKNFVKTFMEIMNSDFLKQRRNGLEINVSEAEIANAVEQSKNKAKAIFSKIIKFGYKPTQFADSFAIAAGGTSFLINRTKTYEKTGLSFKEAREKAFTDFRAIAEENQQSSRTDRTSNIQASNLGRLVFAFNNTPFQMTRLFKKATLDLINGRGDTKTNISKMLYYGAIQNVIFFSLQQAFMAMLFGADEDDREDIDNRTERLLNSTIDSILRGSGLPGAVISTAKNVIMEYAKQEAKGDWRADHGKTLIQALNFSPPLGSKASRIYSALKGKRYEETDFDYIRNQSKIIAAITNIPVDRTITKIDNLRVATSEPIETWKRLALFAGWDQWSLGVYDDLKAIEDKEKGKEKKKSRSEIMKEVWRKRKEEDKKHRLDSISRLKGKVKIKL